MKRAVLLAALLGVLVAPSSASAADECDGLDVCISVPGPWVAVPGSPGGRLRTVYYELVCPRGSIVGGVDAIVSDRSIGVEFLGAMGSPINPGITTSRKVFFVATYARRRMSSFRPFLGCIPTGGGGGTPTVAMLAAVRPEPPVRRVRTLVVRPGGERSGFSRCQASERLVGSTHAVAFRTRRAPSSGVLAAVGVVRREDGARVDVRARRSGAVPAGMRVEVQVHAICARGTA